MKKVNRLVRDNIPAMIEETDLITTVRTLSEEEYIDALDHEVFGIANSYQEDSNIEILVDIIEVVRAIYIERGHTLEDLENTLQERKEVLGGYEKKQFLISAEKESEKKDKVVDLKAMKKWQSISANFQEVLLNNVFCSNCGVTTIVDYTIVNEANGIVLKGQCVNCGSDVARFVED